MRAFRTALRTPVGLAGAVIVAAVLVLAVVGPWIWDAAAERVDTSGLLAGASAAHPFGTDNLGRDIFARVLAATRLSVGLAALATLIGVAVGIPLGVLPVVVGRRVGRLLYGVVNALVAFPSLLLAMFTAVIVGVGAKGAVVGIGAAIAPGIARLTQTLAASVGGSDYVAAARVLGVRRHRILSRHVLPNIAEPVILNVTLVLGQSLLALAALSFLGLGVQAPAYDWGRLLGDGLSRIYVTPLAALGPAAAVTVAGIGFALLGEGLARAATGARRAARQHDGSATAASARIGAAGDEPDDSVLDVRHLSVRFPGGLTPVRDVTVTVRGGEVVGIVGESGSGKSLTALAIAGLVPFPGVVDAERLAVTGRDLRSLSAAERRRLLGTGLAMVFQDPMASLNPALRVGGQLAEVAIVHRGSGRRQGWQRAVERLRDVRIPNAPRRARQHPHEFSGGMRQRAVIAMGLMSQPHLILADEPTTALDVTVQRQVLRLLRRVTEDGRTAGILISHDIAVVGQLCDRLLVMYAGRIVEELPSAALATGGAAHPYTRALVASLPDMSTARDRPLATIPGQQPGPDGVPEGCAFAPRCAHATDRCTARPDLTDLRPGQRVACWHPRRAPDRAVDASAPAAEAAAS
jgi:oligopeptide/dipeptide ABC transporter ATP-binding protein